MSGGTKRRDPAMGNRVSPNSGSGKRTAPNATEPGADLLIDQLEGVQRISFGHWKALCPVHDDTEPSFYIDVRPNRIGEMAVFARCTSCGANGGDACIALGLPVQRTLFVGNEAYRHQKPKYVEPISPEKVATYVKHLKREPELMTYLRDKRGLSDDTIDEYRIGWDVQRDRYVLPVWDADGNLVNLRRYLPGGAPGQKMKNAAGHGKPARLWPDLPSGKVVVCEGEWDALVLRQHGFPAVTGTHGAETFLDEWVGLFADRKVAFLYDCDDAGRTAAAAHARKVQRVARSVAVVDLDPFRDDKWDVSDWFREGRSANELRAWINATFTAGRRGRGRAA
jgi:hypothetical protein